MSKETLKRIIEKIHSSKSFLITAHVNLEGDALGSELAMYILLKKLKKRVVIYNHDSFPSVYEFLPNSRVIKTTLEKKRFDVAFVLDCSDSSRAGKVKDYLGRADCIINIDHHISNTFFGDINWVDPKASSAAQILYNLCEKMKIMDKNIALCLYTGIFTDTGSFTYASTNKEVHRVATNLMNYGIYPSKVYESLHSSCCPTDLKFMGRIISSLKFDPRKKICWAIIKKWEKKDYDLTEIIFSIMRSLKGVEVFLLFKKIGKNETRVNFRSCFSVDVNRIAQFFCGGGHKKASGTTIWESLEQAEKKVIPYVQKYTDRLKK
ncbi:MAG: bifunctional oligoribonuclease/PAP phosphatase NrnA [Candidatus Omnitrophica bacterium]|nr:bifunctional oligoribonuclease/PAP phosphatase NrnA [Candidatus Omnitrophota bacterium]MBU1133689.1 bifunctional oligoribonuclease/PAP phosphatase NrnA [Candidatus Omnitrophota bacterium]MBU1810320.1 bifunctional oligoribonuclease/PAP phosphatase NrnA [Candidatus Omnitrophota bacterium]